MAIRSRRNRQLVTGFGKQAVLLFFTLVALYPVLVTVFTALLR